MSLLEILLWIVAICTFTGIALWLIFGLINAVCDGLNACLSALLDHRS